MDKDFLVKLSKFEEQIVDIKSLMLIFRDAIRGNDLNIYYEPFVDIILTKIDNLYDEVCDYNGELLKKNCS